MLHKLRIAKSFDDNYLDDYFKAYPWTVQKGELITKFGMCTTDVKVNSYDQRLNQLNPIRSTWRTSLCLVHKQVKSMELLIRLAVNIYAA